MSSGGFSFSVSGFSEIIYGAAILTGIYAGVTIVREYFSYKKEELNVNAKLAHSHRLSYVGKVYPFDIKGDIKGDVKPDIKADVKFDIKDDNKPKPVFQKCADCSPYVNETCFNFKTINDQPADSRTNTNNPANCRNSAQNLQHAENNTVAEVVDFDNNAFHLIEEYK